MEMKRLVKQMLRSFGYDIVQFPSQETLGSHLIRLFERLEINCVLDVGAHFGEFGQYLRHHGYSGKLISFEPISGNLTLLRESAKNDNRWRIEALALGNTDDSSTINVASASELSSFFAPNEYCRQRNLTQGDILSRELVTIRKLDSILSELVEPTTSKIYLKMDTQGFDLEVVKGAVASLDRIAALQSEMTVVPLYDSMPHYLDALSYYNSLGFYPLAFFSVTRTADLTLVDFDCIMVHRRAM